MNTHIPTVHQHRILFAFVLLLLGQFVSSLHNHEIHQANLDTDDCLTCLLGNTGADASPIAPTLFKSGFALSILFTAIKSTANKASYLTAYNTRAPPKFS